MLQKLNKVSAKCSRRGFYLSNSYLAIKKTNAAKSRAEMLDLIILAADVVLVEGFPLSAFVLVTVSAVVTTADVSVKSAFDSVSTSIVCLTALSVESVVDVTAFVDTLGISKKRQTYFLLSPNIAVTLNGILVKFPRICMDLPSKFNETKIKFYLLAEFIV